MKTREKEALSALASTIEAVVLGFHLDASTARFELVCESWLKHPDANRAFTLFTFFDVSQFERRIGTYKKLRSVQSTFLYRDVEGTWVIQAVRSDAGEERSTVELSLGTDFGSVAFQYGRLTHERIDLYAKAKGVANWDYFEVGTNRPVDFYNPFGRAWAIAK